MEHSTAHLCNIQDGVHDDVDRRTRVTKAHGIGRPRAVTPQAVAAIDDGGDVGGIEQLARQVSSPSRNSIGKRCR